MGVTRATEIGDFDVDLVGTVVAAIRLGEKAQHDAVFDELLEIRANDDFEASVVEFRAGSNFGALPSGTEQLGQSQL